MCFTEQLLTYSDNKFHYKIIRCPALGATVGTGCHSPSSSTDHLAVHYRVGSVRLNRDMSNPKDGDHIPALSAYKMKKVKRAFRRKCARRELLIWARGNPLLSAVTQAMEADKKEADAFRIMDDISSHPDSPKAFLRMIPVDTLPLDDRECSICTEPYTGPSLTDLARTPTQLPCNHIFCAQCLQTWTMGIQHESNSQKQCPTCRMVFVNGASYTTHFAKEREKLAYAMITGVKVPNGDAEIEGGLEGLPHSSNVVSAPAEDSYNFWNCYVQAGSLQSGPVGFYLHNLLADKDWRQELAAKYNCAHLFGPDSQATTEIAEWFEKRLGMIDEGKGVIGRRTREMLSKNFDWSKPQEKSFLDGGKGVEKLDLEAGKLREDGTVEMKGMEDFEGDVWGTEDAWEDVSE